MDKHQLMEAIATDDDLRHKLRSLVTRRFRDLLAVYEPEDLLQEAYLHAFEKIDRYDPQRGNLQQFVLRLARNKWGDLRRRAEAQKRDYRRTMLNERQASL